MKKKKDAKQSLKDGCAKDSKKKKKKKKKKIKVKKTIYIIRKNNMKTSW